MTHSLTLAAQIAGKIGMVRTWPNLQTIRLAIESEAEYSGVSLDRAAKAIVDAALEDRQRGCDVSRFYFEDARWRRSRRTPEDCPLHPDSGLTQWGACWGCYAARCGSEEATA